jgi:general L-amino acid transport system substrate-binding protein
MADWRGSASLICLGRNRAGARDARNAEIGESRNPPLLGVEGSFGTGLGLPPDWIARIVRHVGNYGESSDRNVGSKSRIGLPRGLSNLWSKGGHPVCSAGPLI